MKLSASTRTASLLLGLCLAAGAAAAQTSAQTAAAPDAAKRLYQRSLAATCAHCHGTDGRAVEGEALIRLAGLSREYLLTQLLAFRTGDRKATIMHQITRGYSEEQLELVAAYFAAQQ
ncbi:MAG: c-type cytochrome [Burkholderiaceae bacterium]|nr:c-type cytochrome [Burkholderiaceae bacterium]